MSLLGIRAFLRPFFFKMLTLRTKCDFICVPFHCGVPNTLQIDPIPEYKKGLAASRTCFRKGQKLQRKWVIKAYTELQICTPFGDQSLKKTG